MLEYGVAHDALVRTPKRPARRARAVSGVRIIRLALGAMNGVLLSACASTPRGPGGPTVSIPFAASSLDTQYGMQGAFEGAIVVGEHWIDVVVPKGTVRTLQRDPQVYWDLRVRAALVRCLEGGQWDVTSESRAARMAPIVGLTSDTGNVDGTPRVFRDTLHLDLGLPPGTPLNRSWIAIVFEWPFVNTLATYQLHTDVLLDGTRVPARRVGRGPALPVGPSERCR